VSKWELRTTEFGSTDVDIGGKATM